MEVRNCRGCGRLFNYVGGAPLCANCVKKLEEKFHEVKKYLYENPHSSISDVSQAMDVSVKQIKQWIREERLTISEPGADGIVCEHCGAPICSGRFCDKCKASMSNSFASMVRKPKAPEPKKPERDGDKMRFLQ